jgi:hypothetical protein
MFEELPPPTTATLAVISVTVPEFHPMKPPIFEELSPPVTVPLAVLLVMREEVL